MSSPYHNKFGLMGGGGALGGTFDRGQVLPFSVMMFSDECGWQQAGVAEDEKQAKGLAESLAVVYHCRTAVANTNVILDLAHPDRGDDPLMELPACCIACGEDISERVQVIPEATKCVDCLESEGDVFRYRGYREPCTESGKHLGGVEQVIRTPEGAEERERYERGREED